MLQLDLSSRKLSTSNPLNPNKLAKTTYHMKDLDMDVWENEGNFGIWIVEKVTSCFCMISGRVPGHARLAIACCQPAKGGVPPPPPSSAPPPGGHTHTARVSGAGPSDLQRRTQFLIPSFELCAQD